MKEEYTRKIVLRHYAGRIETDMTADQLVALYYDLRVHFGLAPDSDQTSMCEPVEPSAK